MSPRSVDILVSSMISQNWRELNRHHSEPRVTSDLGEQHSEPEIGVSLVSTIVTPESGGMFISNIVNQKLARV